jgi:molybdopterin-guanine dinucleotide biosynthesis protein A
VILAAGESSRMGRDKALLPWPPEMATTETFLSAAIRLFSPTSTIVLVVVGKNEAALAPIIYASGASLVNESRSRARTIQFPSIGCEKF